VKIPRNLEWWTTMPGGSEWLESLPSIADACRERWSLEIGPPLEGGNVSHVLDVRLPDGDRAVLKISFPDAESEHEADALRLWGGTGAVRLLAYDESRRALLLERCEPGTPLWSVEDDKEATRIAAEALGRIWHAPPVDHPFRLLAVESARWARELPGLWESQARPFDRSLVDEAVAACIELGGDQGEQMILHQDYHGGNVLRADREPWLVIDPKPLVGEREFDAASLLRDRRWLLGRPGDAVRLETRLNILAADLGLDRERMRRWGIAHALAWGFSDDKVETDMIRSAELLAGLG
jgi:streptomycin 6-kinase